MEFGFRKWAALALSLNFTFINFVHAIPKYASSQGTKISDCFRIMEGISETDITKHVESWRAVPTVPKSIFEALTADGILGSVELSEAINSKVSSEANLYFSDKGPDLGQLHASLRLASRVAPSSTSQILSELLLQAAASRPLAVQERVGGFVRLLNENRLSDAQRVLIDGVLVLEVRRLFIERAKSILTKMIQENSLGKKSVRAKAISLSLLVPTGFLAFYSETIASGLAWNQINIGQTLLLTAMLLIGTAHTAKQAWRNYKAAQMIKGYQASVDWEGHVWNNYFQSQFNGTPYATLSQLIQNENKHLDRIVVSWRDFANSLEKTCSTQAICDLGPTQLAFLGEAQMREAEADLVRLKDLVSNTTTRIAGTNEHFSKIPRPAHGAINYTSELQSALILAKAIKKGFEPRLNRQRAIYKELASHIGSLEIDRLTAEVSLPLTTSADSPPRANEIASKIADAKLRLQSMAQELEALSLEIKKQNKQVQELTQIFTK